MKDWQAIRMIQAQIEDLQYFIDRANRFISSETGVKNHPEFHSHFTSLMSEAGSNLVEARQALDIYLEKERDRWIYE